MLLEVKNLTVYYGAVKAIGDISFHVNDGEIVAMIGPNGAGKSTALKAVSGLLDNYGGSITNGTIKFEETDTLGLRTDQLVRKGIALVPEGRRVFPTMSVLENLQMGAYTLSDKRAIEDNIERIVGLFPRLKERARQKAGTLSSGEQQMLAIGRAMMLQPRLLLADEPSLGLSPNFVDLVFDKLTEINKSGTSVLLVEQNAAKALEVAHRGYVFEIGQIGLEGSASSLSKNPDVTRVFLGE